MTLTVTILGGFCIAIISALISAYVTGMKKVDCNTCDERRHACTDLINQKLGSMQSTIDKIWKKLENSNLTIF